jgi:hypothetical protein
MKRELSQIRERLTSAEQRLGDLALQAFLGKDPAMSDAIAEVGTRDIAEALKLVDYIEARQ